MLLSEVTTSVCKKDCEIIFADLRFYLHQLKKDVFVSLASKIFKKNVFLTKKTLGGCAELAISGTEQNGTYHFQKQMLSETVMLNSK